VHPCL
jgi:hypothetical protein